MPDKAVKKVAAMDKPTQSRSSFAGFRRKAMVNVLRAWREVKGSAQVAMTGQVRPGLPEEDIVRLKKQMEECLDAKGGEISARARSVELGRVYLGLNDTGRQRFLRTLAHEFDVDDAKLKKAMAAYQAATTKPEQVKAEEQMREALIPSRSTILKQFNALPNGFKFLVDVRADLMELTSKDVELKSLEYDLKNILSAWFDIGLLDLVEISWNSPAAILEKLIEYEAVHRIQSWEDLKNRLDADRRVFGFFHNKMQNEPLIFVQVALVNGMADNIQKLLDVGSPLGNVDAADTAIFYSISNAQKGLAGISFGNFLIKRVVDKLSREFKNIKNFATLSPIPGFRAWLDPKLSDGSKDLLLATEVKELKQLKQFKEKGDVVKALPEILSSDWHKDKALAEALQPILMRLCARYLASEKKKDRALDPVAHFHLSNGARLERINWMGDSSAKGFKQSAGMMVNYLYKLSDIDDNHEAYVTEGKIAVGKLVKALG